VRRSAVRRTAGFYQTPWPDFEHLLQVAFPQRVGRVRPVSVVVARGQVDKRPRPLREFSALQRACSPAFPTAAGGARLLARWAARQATCRDPVSTS
jgi:hypothetical protein